MFHLNSFYNSRRTHFLEKGILHYFKTRTPLRTPNCKRCIYAQLSLASHSVSILWKYFDCHNELNPYWLMWWKLLPFVIFGDTNVFCNIVPVFKNGFSPSSLQTFCCYIHILDNIEHIFLHRCFLFGNIIYYEPFTEIISICAAPNEWYINC